MKIYIALLRGINVSGRNIIKMDALKIMFSDLGFENIQTYIQSGNVIFTSNINKSKAEIAKIVSDKINEIFQLQIPTLIIESTELKQYLNQLPFSDYEEKNVYLTFLNQKIKNTDLSKIHERKSETERIKIDQEVIYLDCPNGYGNTKLSNAYFESQLKVLCTTRNLKTCKSLLKISESYK